MRRLVDRRPSPAMVVALIALFVALGGTGYAAVALPKNSVGAAQLKKGAVTPPKVSKKTIALFKGQQGPPGPAGVPGPQGPPGAKGDTGTVDTSSFFTKTESDARFQRRLTDSCFGGRAITSIDASGSVQCSPAVRPIIATPLQNGTPLAFSFTPLPLQLDVTCHRDPGNVTVIRFWNSSSSGNATLNWMLSKGGAASTVEATGVALTPATFREFAYGGARIEGQFVFAHGNSVATVTLHAFDGGTFCEVRGMAFVSTS